MCNYKVSDSVAVNGVVGVGDAQIPFIKCGAFRPLDGGLIWRIMGWLEAFFAV